MSATIVAIASPTPAGIAPDEALVMSGTIRTSVDGATFGPTDVFDLAAGGLSIVATRDGAVVVRANGSVGHACAVAGVESPCLVPRFSELAHARLLTESDFRASLSGGIAVTVEPVPAPPPSRAPAFAFGVALLASVVAAFAVLSLRARAKTPLGRVHAAAKRARRAMRGDRTLAAAAARIDALVARAERLDIARRSALAELAKVDRISLDRKRAAWAAAQSPDAREALDWLTAESAEAARLTADLESANAGLERIAAALRVMALRTREHRGTRARVAGADPVDAICAELDYRDEALAEVNLAPDSLRSGPGSRGSVDRTW